MARPFTWSSNPGPSWHSSTAGRGPGWNSSTANVPMQSRPSAAYGTSSMCTRRTSGVVAHDGLGLEELLEAQLAPLTAVARLAIAAERGVEVGPGAVEVHVAGADAPRHRLGAIAVARDVAGQAVVGVVGDAHGVV